MSKIRLTATLPGANEPQLRNEWQLAGNDGNDNDDSEQLFINNQPPPHIDDLFPDVSKRDAPEWLIDDDLTKYGNFDENAVFSWRDEEPLLADLDSPPPPQQQLVAGGKMTTKNAKSLTIDDLLGEDLFTRAVGGEIVDLIQFDNNNKTTSSEASSLIGNVDPAVSEADAIIQRIRDGSLTLEHNQKLPIFKFKEEILNKLNASSIIFVHGDTGCGKSTQIPVYILEQCLLAKQPCNIIVTQPRRLAASSVAAFAASSHGWRLGSVVGYHVSIDRKTTTSAARNDNNSNGTPADFCSGTRITYCTTGILLQKLIYRPDILNQYTHIIFDEVHERSADLDLAMMLTRQLVQPPNPQTKIVVMSATFEANKYWRYLCTNNDLPATAAAAGAGGEEEESIPDNICVTIHLSQFRVDNAYLDEMMQLHAQQALQQQREDDKMRNTETSSHVLLFDDNNDDDSRRGSVVDDSHRRRSSIEAAALPAVNRFGDMAKLNLALAAFKSEEILEEPKVLLPIMQFAASIVVELEITERRRMVAERKLGIRARDRSSFDGQKGNVEYGKGILIFLPGIEDILTMKALLNQHRMRIRRACGGSSLNIVTLHSSAVSLAEQLRQFEQAPSQQRRVVLSTNVGESSITLPDIGYVIDLCLTKQMFWSPDSAWTSLDVVWASKCSAEQRAGRCGRTCNGFVYRMVPKVIYDGPTIPDVDVPEVQRAPIHTTILRVRAFADAVANNDDENYDDDGQFVPNHQTASPVDLLNMLLEPPSMDIVEKSTMHLKNIGALTVLAPSADDSGVSMPSHVDGILTALGDACIKMPCDVFITRFLMLAFACNLLQEAVDIGAVLSSRDTVFMLSRFSGASDNDFAEEEGDAFAAVRTGVLVDLGNEAKVQADEGFNNEQNNKNDSAGDIDDDYQDNNGKTSTLSDMYSHYQHLLKWDNAGHSDTFAFVAAYRYWKREIRPLAAHSGRARCERLCKRVALCQERLEQVYAIERELTKRLRAMRLLQRDSDGSGFVNNKCWNREPNEQAKLLVLKMLLAAACSPHFFQVASPEHKIPARSYRDYLYSMRTETLSYASNELSNCSLTNSVLVSLKRSVVNLEQQQQQPKKGAPIMTSDRPAEPITIFDEEFIRNVFADLCCHLPVHTRIHFLTPSNLTTLSAPLRVMQFIVEVCRMAHESSATGRNVAADVDGEASLAVQLLLHKLRLRMLEAGNVKRSSGAMYQSVHGGDENCGLPVLAVPDVRKLQIEVPNKTGGNSSKRKLQTLDAVMYDERKPILSDIHARLMQSTTPQAAAKGFMLEVDYENGSDNNVGCSVRPNSYNIQSLFEQDSTQLNLAQQKIGAKLARMPHSACEVFITQQQQTEAEDDYLNAERNRVGPSNEEEMVGRPVNGDAAAGTTTTTTATFLRPFLPIKLFHLSACDRASVIFSTNLCESMKMLNLAYAAAAGTLLPVKDLLSSSPSPPPHQHADKKMSQLIGKCLLYRFDAESSSSSYVLRLATTFYKAVLVKAGGGDMPKYLRCQVRALTDDAADKVLVEFIDLAVEEVVYIRELVYSSSKSNEAGIWRSVPAQAERIRLGHVRSSASAHGARPQYADVLRVLAATGICDWMTCTTPTTPAAQQQQQQQPQDRDNIWATFLRYADGVYEVDILFNIQLFEHVRKLAFECGGLRADSLSNGVAADGYERIDLVQCQELSALYITGYDWATGDAATNSKCRRTHDLLQKFNFASLSVYLQRKLLATHCPSNVSEKADVDDGFRADPVAQYKANFAESLPRTQIISLPSRDQMPSIYLPVSDADLFEQYGIVRHELLSAHESAPASPAKKCAAAAVEQRQRLDWRRVSMDVYSPLAVPHHYVQNMQLPTLQRPVSISLNSVNAVIMTNTAALGNTRFAGRRTEQRMLIATDVCASRSRKTVSLRHTTLMPPLPGLLPLVSMLFTPSVELRVNEQTGAAVGALCGVGSEFVDQTSDSVQSMDAMHDMLVPFDVVFSDKDFVNINRIRRQLSVIMAAPVRFAAARGGRADNNNKDSARENLFYSLLVLALEVGTARDPSSQQDWDGLHRAMFDERDSGAAAFAWHDLPTRCGGGWQRRMVLLMEQLTLTDGATAGMQPRNKSTWTPGRSMVFNATSRGRRREGQHRNNNSEQHYPEQRQREWNVRKVEPLLPEFAFTP